MCLRNRLWGLLSPPTSDFAGKVRTYFLRTTVAQSSVTGYATLRY